MFHTSYSTDNGLTWLDYDGDVGPSKQLSDAKSNVAYAAFCTYCLKDNRIYRITDSTGKIKYQTK